MYKVAATVRSHIQYGGNALCWGGGCDRNHLLLLRPRDVCGLASPAPYVGAARARWGPHAQAAAFATQALTVG